MRRSLVLGLCFALFGATAYAVPSRAVPTIRRVSRSVGFPFEGRLRAGVALRETAALRYVPEYAPHGNFYGTWELVQLLHRTAVHVGRRMPGPRLSVGEISRVGGGRIAGHNSHQNGRDVDVSFYMLDGAGRSFEPWAFANFDEHGRGEGPNVGLRFDDARNWELLSRLITDGDARVQYVFVSAGLKRRLLEVGRQRRASPSILARAARVMVQPDGHPHRNHFHVRIYCGPSSAPQCRDRAPFHPWYQAPR